MFKNTFNNTISVKNNDKNKSSMIKENSMNQTQTLSVLVVDQDPAFRAKVKSELETRIRGHQVLVQEAETEAEGLEILSVVRTHCVILGYTGHDQDIEYWEAVYHQADGDLSLMIATDEMDMLSVLRAIQNGFSSYISKDALTLANLRSYLKHAIHMKQLKETIEQCREELVDFQTFQLPWPLARVA